MRIDKGDLFVIQKIVGSYDLRYSSHFLGQEINIIIINPENPICIVLNPVKSIEYCEICIIIYTF